MPFPTQRAATLALLAGALLLLPAAAGALTLADLDAGAGLTSADGRLTFQNWSVTTPDPFDGSPNSLVGIDLGFFQVDLAQDGLVLKVLETAGPLVAFDGRVGNLVIEFDVVTDSLTVIEGLGLGFTGTAQGSDALAAIFESVEDGGGNPLLDLEVSRTGGGAQDPTDFAFLASAQTEITITKSIVVDVREPGALVAQISEFEQSFQLAPIPEPSAALLFALGAVLVAHSGRLRGRPASAS
jgi:hypothetical protein